MPRRRTAVIAALMVSATFACTPEEKAAWLSWRTVDPVAADAYLSDLEADLTHGRCGEWRDLALTVGWTADQWPTVNRLMFAESRCDPSAWNRSGATGLMQVMPFWAHHCGGTPADLADPTFNLGCALHVYNVQGWQAWTTF